MTEAEIELVARAICNERGLIADEPVACDPTGHVQTVEIRVRLDGDAHDTVWLMPRWEAFREAAINVLTALEEHRAREVA